MVVVNNNTYVVDFVKVAEDRKSSDCSELTRLHEHVIIGVLRHNYPLRIGGADLFFCINRFDLDIMLKSNFFRGSSLVADTLNELLTSEMLQSELDALILASSWSMEYNDQSFGSI